MRDAVEFVRYRCTQTEYYIFRRAVIDIARCRVAPCILSFSSFFISSPKNTAEFWALFFPVSKQLPLEEGRYHMSES